MPPPKESLRCEGGSGFVFAIEWSRAVLFLRATPGRTTAEIALSTPTLRRRLRRGAMAHSNPGSARHRAIAATSGFSISRIQFPGRRETVVRIAAPNRIAFRPRTGLAVLFLSFSFFLFLSTASTSGTLLNKKPTIDWQSWVSKSLLVCVRRFQPRCQERNASAKLT